MEASADTAQYEQLLPLLRLRYRDSYGGKHHELPKLHSWMLHCADPVVRLGTVATFFPLQRKLYVLRANKHSVGALAQYMMTKLRWKVYAFNHEVPTDHATSAEELAIPVHSWFKTRP